MNPLLSTLAFSLAFLTLGYSLYRRFALLGKLAPENRSKQPFKRLLLVASIGFAQQKMAGRKREWRSGIMHLVIFWGALVIGLREVVLIGEGFVHGFQEYLPGLSAQSIFGFWFVGVYNWAEALLVLALGYALWRRLFSRPKRLVHNAEGLIVVLCIMGLMITDLIFDGARFNLIRNFDMPLHYLQHPSFGAEWEWAPFANLVAWMMEGGGEPLNALGYYFGYWGHMLIALGFLNYVPYTKQFHELTALPNVYFGSVDAPHTRPEWTDLENETAWENEAIGLNKIEQLTWKQGLDLYSCTECGRCYDVCPTYVTHKPLTLKWFNDSLKWNLHEETDSILKTGKSSGQKTLVGDVIAEDTLWSCTTCRACEEVCPVSIEHVPRIIAMRQGQALMHERYPQALNSTFKGLEQNGNPWNLGYDKRADWGKDLDIPIWQEGDTESADVLMWVGCMGAYDSRNQRIARATATLLKRAGVRFATLGSKEKCNGDLARRTGNEYLFQMLAQQNTETLTACAPKEIITNCPHCLNSLMHEHPQLEGRFKIYHHSQYIQRLIKEKRLERDAHAQQEESVVFHDPCYLGRYNNEYDAPRKVIKAATAKPAGEMKRHKKESFCCGAGGGQMWMEENIGTRVNQERVSEAMACGAKTIATACPFCMTMLSDGVRQFGKEDEVAVKDIAELALDTLKTGKKAFINNTANKLVTDSPVDKQTPSASA